MTLRVRPGTVTSLRMRILGPPRVTQVSIRLNGHHVTRAMTQLTARRWTGALSASQWLRYGVNRLRVRVVEPGAARHAVLRRRFVVRRTRPLAAAGQNTFTRVGDRVHLNASRSRNDRRGGLRYRWRIVAQPRGSHGVIRNDDSVRSAFVPRRRGRYVVRLTVTGKGERSKAQVGSTDGVTITVVPDSLLIPFIGFTHQDGKPGIQVGAKFYPDPSNGKGMQWLTLNRATLKASNDSFMDGSAKAVSDLTSALEGGTLNQLVILSYPYGGQQPPVQPDQIDAFNNAMKLIGVGPIASGILRDHNKLVIIGVPKGGQGSGWYTHGGGDVDALKGWLMPDASTNSDAGGAVNYRFQPERLPFDTSSAQTASSNTMTIAGHSVESRPLPAGTTGGFQVVEINPIDFTVVKNDTWGSNGSWDGLGPMVDELRGIAAGDDYVAVQSIGTVTPASSTWPDVVSAMAEFGANPNTVSQINGKYAFLGGKVIPRSEDAQSSSAITFDHESGTLSGVAHISPDGYVVPAGEDASGTFNDKLYEIALSKPTPWPYTKAAGDPDAAAYAKALADITNMLPGLSSWSPDLRAAYVGNDNIDWAGYEAPLADLKYPGDAQTCSQDPGTPKEDPGYTRTQFCNLISELGKEFIWLNATKSLFDAYEKALNRSGNQQQVDLHTIGEKIRAAVDAAENNSVAARALAFIETVFGLAGERAAPAAEAIHFLASAYELGEAIASNNAGEPIGDQINTKVGDLSSELASNLSGTANALDRLREVIISDYGRLKELGSAANGKDWAIDVPTTTTSLTTAANAFFSTELMPIAYDAVWWPLLVPADGGDIQACGGLFGHPFKGVPASATTFWHAPFIDPLTGTDVKKPGWWVLGRTGSGTIYAPGNLTDQIFGTLDGGGYGVYLPQFMWSQYTSPPNRTFTC
ncbi:MAG: hypothetical protein WAL22_07220 [Solirubrobacteraceae bacterium]